MAIGKPMPEKLAKKLGHRSIDDSTSFRRSKVAPVTINFNETYGMREILQKDPFPEQKEKAYSSSCNLKVNHKTDYFLVNGKQV
jgi:hypothetical protein